MKTKIATIILATALASCASAPSEIRTPGRQFSFTVAEDYQAVYQKAYERARACYQINAVGADITVQGDLHTNTKSGEIVMLWHNGLGGDAQRAIDVMAIDATHTKVIGSFKSGPVERLGAVLQRWFTENSKAC
jgi:hypothetical protein